jgi:GPI mannosyltransferase 4
MVHLTLAFKDKVSITGLLPRYSTLACFLDVHRQIVHLFYNLLPILLAFLATSAVFIFVDSAYYPTFLPVTMNTSSPYFFSIKFTPLNLFRYNLSTSNLALHGIHPRWLHFVVNLPMIIGISAFGVCITSLRQFVDLRSDKMKVDDYMQRGVSCLISCTWWLLRLGGHVLVYLATVMVGTAIVSLAPHQEPRFLTPLALPSMLVFSPILPKLSPRISKLLV